MEANLCIDENFSGSESIASLPGIIDENCGHRNQTATKKLFDLSCGVVLAEEKIYVQAIGGVQSEQGKYPFLVALLTTAEPNQFFCGASLITTKHVITGNFITFTSMEILYEIFQAAHCVQAKGAEAKLQPRDITAYVGAFDLKNTHDENVARRLISTISIHKDWKHNDIKYDADLAILFLSNPVEFSEFIQPVCLTADASIQNEITGTVVS